MSGEGERKTGLAALYSLPRLRRRPAGDEGGEPGGRRTSWRGKAITSVAVLLLLGAGALLGYPYATNAYTHSKQSTLRSQLSSPSFAVTYQKKQVQIGEGLTRMRVARMGLDVVVVEGTTTGALRAGAGHYPGTALPCEAGNVAIAGHRTTYGHPFENLDQMRPGDEIELTTPFTDCWYKAVPDADFGPTNPHPVDPTDGTVLMQAAAQTTGGTTASLLTMTTCDPKGSASQRLILRAVLEPAKTKVLHPLAPTTGTGS